VLQPAAHEMAPGVWRIAAAPYDFVNVMAFVGDDGQVALVDCGLKGKGKRTLAGLAAMGKSVQDVTQIVLTHAHGDHAGGAATLAALSGAPVSIHAVDAPWARSGMAPPRDKSLVAGRVLNALGRGANGFPPVTVAEEFADGDVLPVAGGLRVVHTPGHTMGHVALLHEPTGVLVTGDSIWNVRRLKWSVRSFCQDVVMNEQTAHVLGELEYDVAAFTHGKHISRGAREQVRGFLRDAATR
jgi:glyoxylase-like metal-dependent hydrolase (beta-lactamase superfamily II)